jgi:probable HAF family extracellular repeat protein
MTDLGTLGNDPCGRAFSINLSGQVVGATNPCNGEFTHAFLSENGGPLIDLQTLIPSGSGVTVLYATDINDRGEIVAFGVLSNGDGHSVVLIPCDEQHHGIEGCDYSLVDATAATQSTAPRYVPSGTQRLPQSRWTNRYHIPGPQSPSR